MNVFVVSEKLNKAFEQELLSRGEVIKLPPNPLLNEAEAMHADMQLFKLSEKQVIAAPGISDEVIKRLKKHSIEVFDGTSNLMAAYPENIKYNVLRAGKAFFHNTSYTDRGILEYANATGMELVNVKQGYASCSSMYFPFCNLILTGDNGIIKAAKSNNYNVCIFKHCDEIILEGYDYGFIGGAGVVLDDGHTVLFNGNFSDRYKACSEELRGYGINIKDCGNGPLCDIGGVVSFTY